jgi:hypothetical protein
MVAIEPTRAAAVEGGTIITTRRATTETIGEESLGDIAGTVATAVVADLCPAVAAVAAAAAAAAAAGAGAEERTSAMAREVEDATIRGVGEEREAGGQEVAAEVRAAVAVGAVEVAAAAKASRPPPVRQT